MPRVHFDFGTGAGTWFIGPRVYRLDQTDWIENGGMFYMTPAGQAYEGNIDLVIDNSGHHAEIHFVDARLAPLGIP